jgi:hypothetical protein
MLRTMTISFVGLTALACAAVADTAIPVANPWVSPSSYAISHHNPGQTDSTPVDGPRLGKDLTLADAQTVAVLWCSAPTYKHIGDDTVVIASNPLGLVKIRATGEDFEVISNVGYPGREDVHEEVTDETILELMGSIDEKRRNKQDIRLLLNSWWMYYKLNINMRTMPSGAYAVIDKDGYHYTNFDKHNLVKSFDNNRVNDPLLPVKHANIVAQLPPEDAEGIDTILGITMTYDGHIVAAATGAVILVDRDLQVVDYVIFPGEWVENSIAADENNGIYVVTSTTMHKLVWTGSELSQDEGDGAWSSPYDVMPEGEAKAMGAASHGSGTTPSLMGFGDDEDKLVVISDGNPEGANVVAFWRDDIPADFEQKPNTQSRRIADQIRIPFESKTTIEASPTIYGNGVLVVNSTYPEPGPIPGDLISNAFLAGTTRAAPLGIQKFDWQGDENRFVKSWAIDHIDNTDWMPPGVSSNGLVYIANKREDRYEYLAADWETGEIVATWRFPDDSVLWNTWGGITVFLEDGDLLLGGFFSVKRFNTGGLR